MRKGFYPDIRPGRRPFQLERPPFRQERPPFRSQPRPGRRHWQEPPGPRTGFVVLLVRSHPSQKVLSLSYIRDLIVSCPSLPDKYSVYSQGALVGELLFRCWDDALEALVYLWGRRLGGAHNLTPSIESSTGLLTSERANKESRLKALFVGHIRGLLDCEAMRPYKRKIEVVQNEIKEVSGMLMKPDRLEASSEEEDLRRSLEAEKHQLESILGEFNAAMECLLACLGEQQEACEEEEGKV